LNSAKNDKKVVVLRDAGPYQLIATPEDAINMTINEKTTKNLMRTLSIGSSRITHTKRIARYMSQPRYVSASTRKKIWNTCVCVCA